MSTAVMMERIAEAWRVSRPGLQVSFACSPQISKQQNLI
jgi:hypothetical protein